MLALTLNKARALGLVRVMLPVEGENPASVRVIEKNGGVLERRIMDKTSGELVALYWIAL
jgi:predicted acetyltransferase